jgi:hypothetical protein
MWNFGEFRVCEEVKISNLHDPAVQRHKFSLYLNAPGRVWSGPLLRYLHLLCKTAAAQP